MDKILKYVHIKSYLELDGNIDDVIKSLVDLKEAYSSEYERLEVEVSVDCYGDIDTNLIGFRKETDDEFVKRLDSNIEHSNKLMQNEIEQLKRLKEKYPEV